VNLNLKTALAAGALAVAAGVGFGAGHAQEIAQPHMQSALTDLTSAHDELQKALLAHEGVRAATVKRVNQAIAEVEAAISAANGD
jgi:hypothetical protein